MTPNDERLWRTLSATTSSDRPRAFSGPRVDRWLQRWLLGCVLVALVLHGVTSTVVGLLGSHHLHRAPVTEPAAMLLEDVRRLDFSGSMLAAPHAHDDASDHRHASFQRHHHDPADASVHSLDGSAHGDPAGGGDTGSAALGALALLASAWPVLAVPPSGPMRWARAALDPIPPGHAHRLDRPPRG